MCLAHLLLPSTAGMCAPFWVVLVGNNSIKTVSR